LQRRKLETDIELSDKGRDVRVLEVNGENLPGKRRAREEDDRSSRRAEPTEMAVLGSLQNVPELVYKGLANPRGKYTTCPSHFFLCATGLPGEGFRDAR
jgi:hypothetical protein